MQVQFQGNGMNGMNMNMNMNGMNNGMNNGMSQSYGSLFIKPVYAQLSHDTDFFSKMSPFIVFVNNGQRVKSSVSHGGGKNPKWADQIQISASSQDRILIELFDHHTMSSNEVIAMGELYVNKVVSMGGNYQDYIPLYYKGQPAGSIMIQATFQGQNQMGMNMGTQMGMNMGTQMGMNVGMQPQQTFVQQNQFPQQNQFQQQTQFQQQSQFPQQTFVQQSQFPQQTVIQQQNGFMKPFGFPQTTFVQQPTIIQNGFMQSSFPQTTVIGGGFGGQTQIIETIQPSFGGFGGQTQIIETIQPSFGGFGGQTTIIENVQPSFGFGFGGQTEIIETIQPSYGGGVVVEEVIINNNGFGNSFY
jgi:hypothetical protein